MLPQSKSIAPTATKSMRYTKSYTDLTMSSASMMTPVTGTNDQFNKIDANSLQGSQISFFIGHVENVDSKPPKGPSNSYTVREIADNVVCRSITLRCRRQ